jgi:general stress protein YciG
MSAPTAARYDVTILAKEAITVACPRCGRRAGAECAEASYPHVERFDAFKKHRDEAADAATPSSSRGEAPSGQRKATAVLGEFGTNEPVKQPPMTCAEAGRRGGEALKKKYGPSYMSEIGRKGGAARKARLKAKIAAATYAPSSGTMTDADFRRDTEEARKEIRQAAAGAKKSGGAK